jgi:hypothetical protein
MLLARTLKIVPKPLIVQTLGGRRRRMGTRPVTVAQPIRTARIASRHYPHPCFRGGKFSPIVAGEAGTYP